MSQEEKKKVDEQWKEEVQKEKERLAKEAETKEREKEPPLPEANFALFLSGLATEALLHLGEMENPLTKKKERNLDRAKYSIGLLSIMQEKTKGNLTDQEKALLEQLLYDLRMRFVKASGKT